jgi:hypothetical protein
MTIIKRPRTRRSALSVRQHWFRSKHQKYLSWSWEADQLGRKAGDTVGIMEESKLRPGDISALPSPCRRLIIGLLICAGCEG